MVRFRGRLLRMLFFVITEIRDWMAGEEWTSLRFPSEKKGPDERDLADVSRGRRLKGVRSLTWDGEQGVKCYRFAML